MDKLRGMETFIAVVECGSFTGAASRLGLSAVMVGKYIAQEIYRPAGKPAGDASAGA